MKILRINVIKSIIFNFKMLPFKDAIKFPILLSYGIKIDGVKRGDILIDGPIHFGLITFGLSGSKDMFRYESKKSYLGIKSGRIYFKGKARIASHFHILVRGGELTVGNNFSCNNSCSLSCIDKISFGDNVLLGGHVVIRDSDGHEIYNITTYETKTTHEPIKIGSHVWICNKVDILKGVTIGDDSVVAYRSFCVNEIKENNVLVGGMPAKVIKRGINWHI
ncbi:Acetyltransferase (isoleucine patch superfamily) [Clostridium cadaveris]|uniref:Acetyltransferase (Isoleucine patch superfamily) n=1 Tax=Clostridium cadaveris TaxID=1529 RepID=A0A1I2NBL7_9CLOT|nr:acyltransferase [Clostridium cadaveris]MDM8312061.1 acyltransferase [Clostridium cadaveris]SFF99117.1 Acetyltransferase (isoleucine patch superfamily) [Clostridium cadaveris]